ncbi:MAG: hypothetical protein LBR82_01925 [Desulfovibrio sp.]|jgi:hypothetical protein|nr:hypothetical protein [Desulfovibrio sp.]
MAGYYNQNYNPGAQILQGVNSFIGGMQKIDQMNDDKAIRGAYDEIASLVGPNGDLGAIQQNYPLDTRVKAKAFSQFVLDRAKTAEGQKAMTDALIREADTRYEKILRPMLISAGEAYRKGDAQSFDAHITQAVANFNFPYQLKPDKDGTYQVLFRSDKEGGWVPTGRTITRDDAYKELQGIMNGEATVLAGADMGKKIINLPLRATSLRAGAATILGNAESLGKDENGRLINYNGQKMMAFPQNQYNDGKADTGWVLYDMNGRGGKVVVGDINNFTQLDPQGKAGTKGGGGRGGGGSGGTSGGSGIDKVLEQEILSRGFVKKDGWYYEPNEEGDKADLRRPLTSEVIGMLRDKMGGGGMGGQSNGTGGQPGNGLDLARPGSAPPQPQAAPQSQQPSPPAPASGASPAQGVPRAMSTTADADKDLNKNAVEPTASDLYDMENTKIASAQDSNGRRIAVGILPNGKKIILNERLYKAFVHAQRRATVQSLSGAPAAF